MSRRRAITRTRKGYTAEVSVFSLDTMGLVTSFIVVPQGVKEVDIPKYCEKSVNSNPKRKFIQVVNVVSVDEVWGMYEEDFYKYAVKLTKDRKFPNGDEIED